MRRIEHLHIFLDLDMVIIMNHQYIIYSLKPDIYFPKSDAKFWRLKKQLKQFLNLGNLWNLINNFLFTKFLFL